MTTEHNLIKNVFEWLKNNSSSPKHGFHNTGHHVSDQQEYVLFHADGHRVDFKKEQIVDPHQEGFKWKDYSLNPDDFDEDGFQYSYFSWIGEDGFKDITIEDLAKKLGL